MFGTQALEGDTADRRETRFLAGVEPVLPLAYRLAYGMLRRAEEAEDAVQEATLNAWRAWPRFRAGSEVRPWFLAIVANQCRRTARGRWWSVVRVADPEPGAGAAPESRVEDALALREALGHLDPRDRLVLVLRYYLDLPFDEVAATLRVSPAAARVRTHRALARLRPRVAVPEEFENG